MTERDELLASIANTIQDYRAGEIDPPTPEHVDLWVSQFGAKAQVPILRELDHVFKRTYVSRDKMRELLSSIATHDSFPPKFWQSAHILNIQQEGSSQSEICELFGEVFQQNYGRELKHEGLENGDLVYLDDAIFSGSRVITDLSDWVQSQSRETAKVYIMVIALHKGGRYWIRKSEGRITSGKKIRIEFKYFKDFLFENRRYHRDKSDVLWPTDDTFSKEGFQPRTPGHKSHIFSNEEGRQLLEREFLKAGKNIIKSHSKVSRPLKPLGFSNFEPGFGSLFATYRNCPNNTPLALWWDLAGWYPLLPRKTYKR